MCAIADLIHSKGGKCGNLSCARCYQGIGITPLGPDKYTNHNKLPNIPTTTAPDVQKIANVLKASQTITNPNDKPLTVQLPGGCSVVLAPGQSVEVKG